MVISLLVVSAYTITREKHEKGKVAKLVFIKAVKEYDELQYICLFSQLMGDGPIGASGQSVEVDVERVNRTGADLAPILSQ